MKSLSAPSNSEACLTESNFNPTSSLSDVCLSDYTEVKILNCFKNEISEFNNVDFFFTLGQIPARKSRID